MNDRMVGGVLRGLAGLVAAMVLVGCGAIEQERRPASSSAVSSATTVPQDSGPAVAAPAAWESAATAPSIFAQSAILIDANTGRTLWEKNADSRRQVASTQKLLTALLVAQRGNLDAMVTIRPEDTRAEPTKLYVKAGETYSRRSLLTAMMVKSSNDAADVLARDHAGSVAAFRQAMNLKAVSLGATSSYFVNPHGLPATQYSTARDMARIAYAAYRNPDLRSMMRLPSYTFRFNNGRTKYLDATNKLLTRSMMFDGMKTGYTNAAGRCLVTSATVGGRSLILVQLGSKTSYIFDDADRMIRWGFQTTGGSGLLTAR